MTRSAGFNRQPWWNTFCVHMLEWPVRFGVDAHLCVLRLSGRRTGNAVILPVGYSMRDEGSLVVHVGRAEQKSWWRNFTGVHPVDVLLRGRWHQGIGRVVAQQTAADGTTEVDVVIDIGIRHRNDRTPTDSG